jgi:hypothetical protein
VFDGAILEAAARDQEVELTTFGRNSGKASRRIVWIMVISDGIYVRSGLGMARDWPKKVKLSDVRLRRFRIDHLCQQSLELHLNVA